jgi:hypothetical protein
MKGRKHDLNYPFDPAAVSDPACWLPPALGAQIHHRIPAFRHLESPSFKEEGVLDLSAIASAEKDGTVTLTHSHANPAR